jgi:hypothetical protein
MQIPAFERMFMPSPAEEWARQREARIQNAIGKNSELQAFFQSLNNQFFDQKAISNFVDTWNAQHPQFSKADLDSSVQKDYEAKGNATITVWVSGNGKVRLMANY